MEVKHVYVAFDGTEFEALEKVKEIPHGEIGGLFNDSTSFVAFYIRSLEDISLLKFCCRDLNISEESIGTYQIFEVDDYSPDFETLYHWGEARDLKEELTSRIKDLCKFNIES